MITSNYINTYYKTQNHRLIRLKIPLGKRLFSGAKFELTSRFYYTIYRNTYVKVLRSFE